MNLEGIEGRMILAAGNDYPSLIRLFIKCLDVIPVDLPSVGLDAVQSAKRFWIDREATEIDLESARVACWEFLDRHSASTNDVAPEYCALRAVICVLYPDPSSDDLFELVDSFNEFVCKTYANTNVEVCMMRLNMIVDGFSRER